MIKTASVTADNRIVGISDSSLNNPSPYTPLGSPSGRFKGEIVEAAIRDCKALLLTPLWARWGERVGKKRGYVAASLLLAAGAALAVLARGGNDVSTFVATGLVGVGYAGCQVFPMAMLPDVAAVDAARTGENRAGVYTGVWTAGETLGLALGPALFALLLALGGYLSSEGRDVSQPGSALTGIALGFSVVPALLTVVSLWWLRQYTLDPAEVSAAEGAVR